MAKPGSTHVIEIETGIGEPAFIPLTVGQELQPISVGKKGMWRIESARVLDVHAFVYFDGSSLFVQSADDAQAAAVDGYKVGKAWTELHAPCHIEIGAARLRFRSLSEAVQAPAPPPAPPTPQGQGGAGGTQPPPRPAAGAPLQAGHGDDETRVGTIDAISSRRIPVASAEGSEPRMTDPRMVRPTTQLNSGMAPVQAIPQAQHPPNLQQPPAHQSQPMNLGSTQPRDMLQQAAASMPPQQPQYGPPPQGYGQPAMNPYGPPQGMQQQGMPPQGYGPPGMSGSVGTVPGSGPYASMSGSMNTLGSQGSGQYGAYGSGAYPRGAPTIQTNGPPAGNDLLAKFKELNPTKRILVLLAPFCIAVSAYLLLFDDDPPPPQKTSTQADAGANVAAGGSAATPGQCPPGFVPYPVPAGGAIVCVPQSSTTPVAPVTSAPIAVAPPTTTGKAPPPDKPGKAQPAQPNNTADNNADGGAPAPTAAGGPMQKTLERQAVDAVAINDYTRAAAIYDQLLLQNPNNRVYAEAARILKQKAATNSPQQAP